MQAMEAVPWAIAGICALAACGSALLVRTSGPVVAAAELRAMRQELEEVRAHWGVYKAEMEQLSEAISADYQQVRRARNRLSAAESKAEKRANGPVDEMGAAVERWRAQGLL